MTRLPWWLRGCHTRHWLCEHGIHRIKWSESAYPGSYDPPEPPEPGWACIYCGEQRMPYRAWWWDAKWMLWQQHLDRWGYYDWRRGRVA